MGLRPREIVQFYVSEGEKIFGDKSGWRGMRRLWKRKFSAKPLEVALKRCFGERRLADCVKPLVIPSYNLDRNDVYLFKTPHHPRLTRDWKVPLWKVALATSAAPTYFASCSDVDHIRLIDGGVWANNPAMVGVVEAYSMFGKPLESIAVLSLGATSPTIERPKSLTKGGMFQWRSAGIDVALRGQSCGVQCQVQHLLGADRGIRLDAVVADGVFALDRLTEPRLLSEAATTSRNFSPTFASLFQPHTAASYTPLQPVGQHAAATAAPAMAS